MYPYFRESFNEPYRVLILCQKVKALKLSNFVISGQTSRHSGSPFVLAKRNSSTDLAELIYFVECVAVSKSNPETSPVRLWIAAVNWLMEHPCKLWYGHPLQVWTATKSPGISLIPVIHILCRVVYVKCTRDFGRMLINDTVYVIVPLST